MNESPLKLQVDARNWDIVPLKSASVLIKDGTHGTHERVQSGIPLLSAKNISPFGKITIDEDDSLISEDEYQKIHSKYELRKGDLLLTVVGTLGRSALINSDNRFSIQRSIGVIRCLESKVVPEFLYQFTGTDYFQRQLVLRSNATAQAGIYLGELAKIEVPRPPLPEQQKIAAILSSVDDVIEKTRAQIDKLKDLKTGTMQELLTKGIAPGGLPHREFKDSPLGKIPKNWDVTVVERLLSNSQYSMRSGPFGSSLLKKELVDQGIPFLGIDNVHAEYFRTSFKRFVTAEKFEELKKYAVFPGDIMVTIMGTVGRCCVVPKGMGRALSSKHVWTITLDSEKYIPDLLCWQINFANWVGQQFKNESQGGVMDSISSRTLKGLIVPVPPLAEQIKIAQIYRTLLRNIEIKQSKLSSLECLKRALMQDLLTGKVRVNVSEKESAVA